MCNDFGNRISYRAYVEEFSHLKLPLLFPGADSAPNMEPREVLPQFPCCGGRRFGAE